MQWFCCMINQQNVGLRSRIEVYASHWHKASYLRPRKGGLEPYVIWKSDEYRSKSLSFVLL